MEGMDRALACSSSVSVICYTRDQSAVTPEPMTEYLLTLADVIILTEVSEGA